MCLCGLTENTNPHPLDTTGIFLRFGAPPNVIFRTAEFFSRVSRCRDHYETNRFVAVLSKQASCLASPLQKQREQRALTPRGV